MTSGFSENMGLVWGTHSLGPQTWFRSMLYNVFPIIQDQIQDVVVSALTNQNTFLFPRAPLASRARALLLPFPFLGPSSACHEVQTHLI